MSLTVRPFRPEHRESLEEICLEAGGRGGNYTEWMDVSPDLFLDFWLNYYLDREPENALVAERDGRIVGYLLAGHSSRRRARAMWFHYFPRILWRVLVGRYRVGLKTFRSALRIIRDWLCYGFPKYDKKMYTSELHINVGRQNGNYHEIVFSLLLGYYARARELGVKGVHGLMALDEAKLRMPVYMGFRACDVRPTSLFPGRKMCLVSIGCRLDESETEREALPNYDGEPKYAVRRRWWFERLMALGLFNRKGPVRP